MTNLRIGLALGIVLLASCAPGSVDRPLPPTGVSASSTQPQARCLGVNIANPAAVYCALMGFSSKIVDTPQGQAGACAFPDGTSCDEWAFLRGACGQEHSYCALHGYGIQTVHDGQDSYSQEYAVCTDASGKVVGTVTDLSGLQAQLTCGSQP